MITLVRERSPAHQPLAVKEMALKQMPHATAGGRSWPAFQTHRADSFRLQLMRKPFHG